MWMWGWHLINFSNCTEIGMRSKNDKSRCHLQPCSQTANYTRHQSNIIDWSPFFIPIHLNGSQPNWRVMQERFCMVQDNLDHLRKASNEVAFGFGQVSYLKFGHMLVRLLETWKVTSSKVAKGEQNYTTAVQHKISRKVGVTCQVGWQWGAQWTHKIKEGLD